MRTGWRVVTMGAALATTMLAAGCASMSAGADFSPGTDLRPYRTFGWGPHDALPTGDPRLDGNPFFEARVHAAVKAQLEAKGVRFVEGGTPDLLVHHHASVTQRVDVIRADRDMGYASGAAPSGDAVAEYDEGTLVVDVVDAKTSKVVWRGWAQTDLAAVLRSREAMQKRVEQACARMFAEYGAR